MKTSRNLTIIIMSAGITLAIYAMYLLTVGLPGDTLESQYIELGRMKMQQMELHQANELLRAEIEQNGQLWRSLDADISAIEAELFQTNQ